MSAMNAIQFLIEKLKDIATEPQGPFECEEVVVENNKVEEGE